jgi:hypothetical protein
MFTVYKGEIPLVHCLLAIAGEGQDVRYWTLIEAMYLDMTDKSPLDWALPEKPSSAPWLAVVLLPGLAFDPEAAEWLGDFERCMVP